MTIEEIVDELETLGKKKTDREVWETTLYFYGAIMLNIMALKKDPEVNSNDHIIFYAIVLAGSGVGKTFSAKQLEKLWDFDGYPERYIRYLNKYYDQSPDAGGLEEKAEDIRYMPKDMILNLEGTQEGLFFTAKAQLSSNFGSLNIFTDEFGDVISGSKDIINKLKQMYDGEMLPKMIKGNETTETYSILKGIVCNFLGMGTSKGFSEEASKDLIKSVQSGLFRRTFIIDSGESYAEIIENTTPNNVEKSHKHLQEVLLKHTKISSKNITYRIEPRIFPHSEDYLPRLAEFSTEIIARYNHDRTNERKSLDTGAELMSVDLSYIIAFIEGADIVTAEHLDKAIEYFYRTRASAEYTFSPKHPHKAMFNLLSQRNGLTITEMSELDYTIPIKANAVRDAVAGLRELCYMHNQHLKISIGAVVRYSIEHLPMNKLDKIILSVSQDNKGAKCINYKPTTLSWKDIPRLVVSENFDSFTCCHYEITTQAPMGHRQAASFVEEQNLIAFDIDEGMSIEEVKEILQDYTYLIYTTKSHQIDKNDIGEVCDRFRILLPTKTKFYVTPDQHKAMYENLEILLKITANDVKTRNVSRLFYTNPNAEIIENKADLIDVLPCIPDTILSQNIMPNIENVAMMEATNEIGKREAGMMKWAIINSVEGNRNNTLHAYMMFLIDLNSNDVRNKTFYLNAMINAPLPEHEIETMLKARRL